MMIPRNMIGPKLRQIRGERGLTQSAFVLMCQRKGWDISRETLAKIESQYRWVSDFEAVFLASVLDVPMGALLPDTQSESVARNLISKLERKLE